MLKIRPAMRTGQTPVVVVTAVAVLSIVLSACGSGDSYDRAATEREARESFESQYSLALLSVTCPDDASMDEGDALTCEAITSSALDIDLILTFRADEGFDITVKQSLLETEDLVAEIEASLIEQFQLAEVEVGCNPVEFIEPGGSFECPVTSGEDTAAIVVFVDENLEPTWELRTED